MIKMLEYVKIVFKNLKSRRLRSFLTLLGIVIGIVAIVLLYSFANSIEDIVDEQFERLGTNRILIAARGTFGFGPPSGAFGLTEDDANTVSRVSGIRYVQYYFGDRARVKVRNTERFLSIQGVAMDNIEEQYKDFDFEFAQGRAFNNHESGNIVILGSQVADRFDTDLFVRNTIEINGRNFRIIGILEEIGDMSQDYLIQMPIDSMRDITNTENEITGIIAIVHEGVDIETVSNNIETRLERTRGDENFLITTPEQIRRQAEDTLGVVKLVILSIASISLIVGGLGIMNSMYTSVLERTKDIGIMKAIGAKNNDILNIFLIESALLGLLGGVFALIFSFIVIQVANLIIKEFLMFEIIIRLSPDVVALAIVFAITIGILSGLFPAIRAMKLKPVDALRYE